MRKKPINPDTPLTTKEMDAGVWMHGVDELPAEAQAAVKRMGRPTVLHPKEKVTVRLDADLLSSLRASGKGWQTRMNARLREAINAGEL